MVDISPPRERRSELERQMVIGIGGVLTAGVVWMASSVADSAATIAGVKVQIEALREQIQELKASGRVAVTADEAAREFARVDGSLADLEQRLRRLEAVPRPGVRP